MGEGAAMQPSFVTTPILGPDQDWRAFRRNHRDACIPAGMRGVGAARAGGRVTAPAGPFGTPTYRGHDRADGPLARRWKIVVAKQAQPRTNGTLPQAAAA
jgi:hypothetical protein